MILLCGAGGVCEATNENWLSVCRIKDHLQPKSPPRRIYNPCVAVWDRSGLIFCGLSFIGNPLKKMSVSSIRLISVGYCCRVTLGVGKA